MNNLPKPETEDPKDIDHGELFRASARHLPTGPMLPRERKVLIAMLAATVAAVVALVSIAAR